MKLFPMQVTAVRQMSKDLYEQGWALLKCGQRSGKGTMVFALIQKSAYRKVCWLSNNSRQTVALLEDSLGNPGDLTFAYKLPTDKVEEKTLVVLDEAMWLRKSFDSYEQARKAGCDVVIVSSRGPEYDRDLRWHELQGQSYHTWELNPNISRKDLQQFYEENPLTSARDFEAY